MSTVKVYQLEISGAKGEVVIDSKFMTGLHQSTMRNQWLATFLHARSSDTNSQLHRQLYCYHRIFQSIEKHDRQNSVNERRFCQQYQSNGTRGGLLRTFFAAKYAIRICILNWQFYLTIYSVWRSVGRDKGRMHTFIQTYELLCINRTKFFAWMDTCTILSTIP